MSSESFERRDCAIGFYFGHAIRAKALVGKQRGETLQVPTEHFGTKPYHFARRKVEASKQIRSRSGKTHHDAILESQVSTILYVSVEGKSEDVRGGSR